MAGYAFDQPELLAAQWVWGVAHGVRLLAQACARSGQGDAAEAWVEWQERERARILEAGHLLGIHYFRQAEASPDMLVAALGLRPVLELPHETLGPACASLREALARPRYDLGRLREAAMMAAHDGQAADFSRIMK